MTYILCAIATLVLATSAFVAIKVAFSLFRGGGARVRSIREDGGGISELMTGELQGGQRSSSGTRANGLYMSVAKGGRVTYKAKSMVTRALV